MTERPAWHAHAACRDHDVNLFFPQSNTDPNVPIARRICAACPVRTECFETACANRETQGIWAGYLGGRELHYARTGRHRPKVGAKLTPDAVRDIRSSAADGVTQRALAARHGVTQGTINKVLRRALWDDVA